jgi:DNA-binding MarR family transcriptional regulator
MTKLIQSDEIKRKILDELYNQKELVKMAEIYKKVALTTDVRYSTFLAKVNTLERNNLIKKMKIPLAGNRVYLVISESGKKVVEKINKE